MRGHAAKPLAGRDGGVAAMTPESDAEPARIRDGMELAALRLLRRLGRREQDAWLRCGERAIDGLPLRESVVLAFIELGYSETEARKREARVFAAPPGNWRELLD